MEKAVPVEEQRGEVRVEGGDAIRGLGDAHAICDLWAAAQGEICGD